jgi:lathosterol oxidase
MGFFHNLVAVIEVVLGRYIIVAGFAYLIFYVLLKNKFIHKKVQQAFPEKSIVIYELINSIMTMLIFSVITVYVLFIHGSSTLIYSDIDKYGWFYYYFSIIIMFIIHDAYFYWMHRLIHIPIFYKYIHLTHHKSTNPTPFASFSFHFVESIFQAGILPLIAFTLPVHGTAMFIFLIVQFLINVYGHLGYEIYSDKFRSSPIGKWINSSINHNAHHKFANYNFGLYFTFWDRWMGTLKKEDE